MDAGEPANRRLETAVLIRERGDFEEGATGGDQAGSFGDGSRRRAAEAPCAPSCFNPLPARVRGLAGEGAEELGPGVDERALGRKAGSPPRAGEGG